MRSIRKQHHWPLVLLLTLGGFVAAGTMQVAAVRAEDGVITEASLGGGTAELDRWWGAAGAALCGAEMWLIRTSPALGMNPAPLAAGIGGCLLALLDCTTT